MSKEWRLDPQGSLFDQGFREGGETASAGFAKVMENSVTMMEHELKGAPSWKQHGAALWMTTEKLLGSVFFGMVDWAGKTSNEFSKGPVAMAWKAIEIPVVGIADGLSHVLGESFNMGQGSLDGKSEFRTSYEVTSLLGEAILIAVSLGGVRKGAGKINGVGPAHGPAWVPALAVDTGATASGTMDLGALVMSGRRPLSSAVSSTRRSLRGLMQRIREKFHPGADQERYLSRQLWGDDWEVYELKDSLLVIQRDPYSNPGTYHIYRNRSGEVVAVKSSLADHVTEIHSPPGFMTRPPRDLELRGIPRYPPGNAPTLDEFAVARQIATHLKVDPMEIWVMLVERVDAENMTFRLDAMGDREVTLVTSTQERLSVQLIEDQSGGFELWMSPPGPAPWSIPVRRPSSNAPPHVSWKEPLTRRPIASDGVVPACIYEPNHQGHSMGQQRPGQDVMPKRGGDGLFTARQRQRARLSPYAGFQRALNLDGLPLQPKPVNEPWIVRPPEQRRQMDVYGREIPVKK